MSQHLDLESMEDDKGIYATVEAVTDDHSETHDHNELRRGLSSRHIAFIGIGGGIGVGLFIGVGQALATGGPLGLLIAYSITAVNVWATILSIAEIFPTNATFPALVSRFVDPSLGFAVGWTYWYGNAISVALEVVAVAVLVQYWTDKVHNAVWITVSLIGSGFLNFLPVRFFGDSEVATASIKVITLLGLIILSLVITLGGAPDGHRRGFEYWRNPGPINEFPPVYGSKGRFVAFFVTLCNSAFAYSGSEVIVLTASEAGNPTKQLPRSVRLFIYRLVFFYVIGVLMIGMIVPSNHPDLVTGTGNANSSPWVIAIRSAGIKVAPSIVNAAIITSAWSAGNTYLFVASRTLHSMALDRQAPKFFAHTTKRGVPVYALGATLLFGCLGYLSVGGGGAAQAFDWLVAMITLNTVLNWGVLCITFIRFYKALRLQGMSRDALPYKSPMQPYIAWFAAIFNLLVCLFSGTPVFLKGLWNVPDFIAYYISLVVFVVPWLGYKLITRCKWVRLEDADLHSGVMDPASVVEEKMPTSKIGRFVNALLT